MMPARVAIRHSAAGDVPRLLEIWRRALDATHHFVNPADRAEIDGLVADTYLPSAPLWVAADERDRPLAFMGVTDDNIDTLFVDPDAHGRGIGRALIAHAMAGWPAITVDVNEQNERAIGFYERLGFRRTGRSATDGDGRPYPILTMRREAPPARDG